MSALIHGVGTGRITVSLKEEGIMELHVEQTSKNIWGDIILVVRQKDWDWLTEQIYTELNAQEPA